MSPTQPGTDRTFNLLYRDDPIVAVKADTIEDVPGQGWVLRRGSKIVGQYRDPEAWWMTDSSLQGPIVELAFTSGVSATFVADDSGSVPDSSIDGTQWTLNGNVVALVRHPANRLRGWQMN